ncbi:MAG: hypothetical protein BGO78_00760 [Chloroflexi bacterium 44-23]|nr:MAG: hypothetical protein BGO78_00760 [Chloroflexi bacterium 44-23]
MKKIRFCIISAIILGLSLGCSYHPNPNPTPEDTQTIPKPGFTLESPTPFLPLELTPTTIPPKKIIVSIPAYWDLNHTIVIKNDAIELVTTDSESDCKLTDEGFTIPAGEIVLNVVKQFPITEDGLTMGELADVIRKSHTENGPAIRIDERIYDFVTKLLPVDSGDLFTGELKNLTDFLYKNKDNLAIIPFEETIPAYKVLQVDGQSPFDQGFDSKSYPLTFQVGYVCKQPKDQALLDSLTNPFVSNRDSKKFASVLITGTTALTRAIAAKMELNGMNYPGEKVKFWFDQADISHISNEVSFNKNCPPANPYQTDLMFCSRPEYAQLFAYLGVDIVELSGNHLADKGVPALENTFSILREMRIPYYAAGFNREEAEQPVRFDINENKFSFLGCNQAGPSFVWLTEILSGVLPCDMDRMAGLVEAEVNAGYLPIVTFQYGETYQFDALPYQKRDFRQMVDAGAVIVSGSQAHVPMSMEIYRGAFIHYGLGNLFFDQMDIPVVGTRREFLDRHIFYNGRYMGVQLLTAMLEDYSQPRPMTNTERDSLLQDAFKYFQRVEEE